MDWTGVLVVVAGLGVFLGVKRLGWVSAARARACLQEGAAVIDVRSEGEFASRHLPGAINIPLGSLADSVGRHVPDRDRPVLLHCLSGTRSGLARHQLRRLGYRKVFNLGSYRRAEAILRTPR